MEEQHWVWWVGAGPAPRACVAHPKDGPDSAGTVPQTEACPKKDFLSHLFMVGGGAGKESSRAEPEAGGAEK